MAARRYCAPNLEEPGRARVAALVRTLAHLADTAVFLYLGLSLPWPDWSADSARDPRRNKKKRRRRARVDEGLSGEPPLV